MSISNEDTQRFLDAGSGMVHISDGGATTNSRGIRYEDTVCGRRLKVREPRDNYRRDLCSKCYRKSAVDV